MQISVSRVAFTQVEFNPPFKHEQVRYLIWVSSQSLQVDRKCWPDDGLR